METSEIVSNLAVGISVITFGAFVLVYPRPGLVIVADVIVPFAAIFAVAVAVVPIPTPIAFGAENLISVVVPYIHNL